MSALQALQTATPAMWMDAYFLSWREIQIEILHALQGNGSGEQKNGVNEDSN